MAGWLGNRKESVPISSQSAVLAFESLDECGIFTTLTAVFMSNFYLA